MNKFLRTHTSSGTGFKFSLMYPSEGGINALLFPCSTGLTAQTNRTVYSEKWQISFPGDPVIY